MIDGSVGRSVASSVKLAASQSCDGTKWQNDDDNNIIYQKQGCSSRIVST